MVSDSIRVKWIYFCGVWVRLGVNMSVLKYQNTKTALYKLLKNHWHLLDFFPAEKKFLVAVSLEHPLVYALPRTVVQVKSP